MERNKETHFDRRALLGIILVGLGALLLAENMGWLNFAARDVIISWPMLLIIIGVAHLTSRNKFTFGLILVAVGIFFLLPKFIDVNFNFWQLFWPVILVVVGISFILRKRENIWDFHAEKNSNEVIDDVNIFGGSEKKITSKNFRGGKITSIFGGSNYDFLDSQLSGDKNVLDMINIFGGSKLVVPAEWDIHVDIISIFGGFADKRHRVSFPTEGPRKELYITGVAIFGGGEIRSI